MPKRAIQADDLLRFHFVGDPQISPDGLRVLFTKKHINDKNKYITNLFTVDLEGHVAQWTQGDGGAGGGRWSPEGSRIAFVSGREGKQPQIFLLSTSGGEARKLTDLPEGSIGELRWSPDGRKIAFTFREADPVWTQKAAKEREEKGLSTPPREIDTIWYRLDGDGYFLNTRFALYVVEVETGEFKVVDKESWDGSYSFDWSPDSQQLAIVRSAAENPAFDPPNDQIYRVSLSGQSNLVPGLPKGQKATVRWSPDGTSLAYLGDVDENDPWGVRNTKAYVVSIEGGAPRCLTEGLEFDLNVATLSDSKEASFDGTLFWSPDSKALYTSIGWHGENQMAYVPVEQGGVSLLTQGQHQVTVGNCDAQGERFGVLWGDPLTLPEVGVYDLSTHAPAPRILTSFNKSFHDEVQVLAPEAHWIDSTDGAKVHVWVIRPSTGNSKSAAILQVHGGPHTQYGWAYFHEFQTLAAQGYVVVYSNPRGSKGYGEGFCAAIKGDWGTKDWDDIAAVKDWMKAQPDIDSNRMGIMGGSYGGYITNWAIGHTHDFAAAITDRCVSNFVSMAGNSDFPFNKDGYFGGCAWGDLDRIKPLWRQSPIAYFEGVKTPTLVIHSEGDLRCNVEQGEQVFHALQAQGVPSRFVRYPQSTFHGMSRNGPPDLRLHRLTEISSWMGKYLKV